MNKFLLFGTLVFILIMITFVVDSYAIVDVDVIRGITDGTVYHPTGHGVSDVWSMTNTFRSILFFEIDGDILPDIFVLGVVYPIVGIILYMVIDVVKDMIPFT